MKKKFTILIEQGVDGYLISEVIGLPGCRSQAKTQDELIKRTKEAIELYLEAKHEQVNTRFLGLQQIDVEI
jgi:predicted RNase H-like HicB family nuclease